MEYVDGVNLRQAIRDKQLAPPQALDVVGQVCGALQFAHAAGVVHRDIKPENILLDRNGVVKIADFGLAKLRGASAANLQLTATNQVMGTPHYMAPEQMERPQEVDHRADIYSLGVVFYELLTGELPLGRFPPPSQKAGTDARLDEVVLRALERDPGRRFQQAGEVKTAVESLHGSPAGGPAATRYDSVPFVGELKAALGIEGASNALALEQGALLGLVAALAALAGGLLWTENGILLVAYFYVALFSMKFPWRPPARRVAGVLLTMGGLGLGIIAARTVGTTWLFLFATGVCFVVWAYIDAPAGGGSGGGKPSPADLPSGLSSAEGEVFKVLQRCGDSVSVYLPPDIPAGGLHNARKASGVPPEERVLGIIDLTGDEDDMTHHVLFATTGLYYCVTRGKKAVAGAVPYAEFPGRVFVNHGKEVYLGGDQFLPLDPDEGHPECEDVVNLLNEIRAVVGREQGQAAVPKV
jgi:hypothetical protein